ncbi:sigma-70 family RNA polymerase sigma factor [Hymenobacter caeli]|uniref:RNA polymerase sigma-70 factor (ECF subfamily) n=1 Tax=Hymenobacter caeli TaxID=2735894 RepID=A0ABX2FMP0_9BACT|nr:sigma-70 family RNA polymerase sigma factor [Hymenobacter caeli]NRT18415.1 RNA polymerase sigma-70 factor (ECF subfamily) [Hymenobacter caeli]
MAKFDDAALDARLTLLRQTDPAAFLEQLFQAFYAPLGSLVYRTVPDRAAVEDILQDVFLRVWQGVATLPALDSHRAYLTRMALNAALRHQQRAQRQVAWDEAPLAPAPVAPDALAGLHAAEAAEAVAAALAHLPPQCRAVFELSRYEELSYLQIAEALEISPKTVENQMGKALRILRRELAGVLKNLYGLLFYLLACRAPGGGLGPAAPGMARPAPTQFQAYFSGRRGGSVPGAYLSLGPVAFPPSLSA